MRVTKFKNLQLAVLTIAATLWTSCMVLLSVLLGRCTRGKVDQLMYAWADRLLRIVKASYKIINIHQVKLDSERPYILMSNHCSHYDIPIICLSFPDSGVRMLAKKELFRLPIWGDAMRASEILCIDRGNGQRARHELNIVKEKMLSGIVPWIAPEGTRSPTGQLQKFKKGGFWLAMEAHATIIPIVILGSKEILPTKTLNFGVGEHITVHICKPIVATDYEDIQQLMLATEASMRTVLGDKKDV